MSSPDLLVAKDRCGDVALATNPFVSNRYHFGMLLGVADLEAQQAYHRGKMWLHNAWLHGPGAVWGLRVEVRVDRNELVVHPGLAIDHHGRELSVAEEMCVDLTRWFVDRRPDDLEVVDRPDGGIEFVVHVELCHDACLDRPVPSISEPCDDASLDTAYSRAIERGLPRIVGGEAPDEPTPWYPRLRQFFGQVPATDPLVTAALTAVDAADPVDRPAVCVVELRRLAAEDTMDLQPADGATAWSPAAGDGCIPLAEIAVHLRPEGDSFVVVGDGDAPTSVDNHVRPAHVRTRTIQELLCHAHGLGPPAAGPGDAGDETDLGDASGPRDEFLVGAPRAIAGSAELHGSALLLTFTAPLNRATVNREAFEVCSLRADGWSPVDIDRADLDDSGTVVSLRLGSTPRVRPVRVVANGSGAAPVVGADGRPLVGVTGEAGVAGGRDAALMIAASDDASDDE